TGPTGPQGLTGPTGPTGPQGPTGPISGLDILAVTIDETQDFTDGIIQVVEFDTVIYSNTANTYNTGTHELTINQTGIYRIEYTVSVAFPGPVSDESVTTALAISLNGIVDGTTSSSSTVNLTSG